MSTRITSLPSGLAADGESAHPESAEVNAALPEDLATKGYSADQQVLVEVRRLRKSFGDHLAVKDVSFSLHTGEVIGLLGPNGAGKSTTMSMVAGLLTPTDGEILLGGREFDGCNPDQRRLIGIVPQEYAIYEDLNAVENLKFFGKLYGLRGQILKDRCEEVINQIGLSDSAYRRSLTYSGGMKRRLNFGIALMHKPAILILDEPTVGVDPQSRSHLMDCIRQQVADGVGIIYASHYMEEVQSICERVVIIDHGEVLANDSVNRLLAGLAADVYLYVDHTAGIANELGDLARVGTGSDGEPAVIVSGHQQTLDQKENPAIRYGLGSLAPDSTSRAPNLGWRLQTTLYKLGNLGIRVSRVETQQSNLEGLFLKLTGKRLRD